LLEPAGYLEFELLEPWFNGVFNWIDDELFIRKPIYDSRSIKYQ